MIGTQQKNRSFFDKLYEFIAPNDYAAGKGREREAEVMEMLQGLIGTAKPTTVQNDMTAQRPGLPQGMRYASEVSIPGEFMGRPTDEQDSRLLQLGAKAAPGEMISQLVGGMFPKAPLTGKDRFLTGDFGALDLGPDGSSPKVVPGTQKEPGTSADYNTALTISGGDPVKAGSLFNTWKNKAGVNINMGGDKAITGVDAGRYKSTVESLDSLNAMEPFLDQMMGAMSSGAQTGFGQEQILSLKQAWKTATGQDLPGTSEQELFQAAASYLGPRMRVAGSGASSDKDTALFLSAIPKLGRTQEGNKLIRQMYGRIKERKAQIAEIQQDLLGRHERIPVMEEKRAVDSLGPLFSPEEKSQLEAAKTMPDRVIPPGTPSATGPGGKKLYFIDGKWQ